MRRGCRGVLGAAVWLPSLLACADLHPPPAAGAAGSDGMPSGATGAQGALAGDGAGGVASGAGGQGGVFQAGGGAAAGAGAAGSSQGLAGTAGTNSAAGSMGAGGTSGASGSAGTGGSGGTGGAAAAGAAGQAGGAGGPSNCASRPDGDIQLYLHQDITNDIDNEIHPAFLLTRTGLSVPLKELSIRYYFSGEAAGNWILTCLWVTKAGDSGHGLCDEGTSMKVVALDPPRQKTDQYLEISFAGVSSATLSEGFPIEARVMFWRDGHPLLNLGNDYSFAANRTKVMQEGTLEYKQTTKVTVYRKGALIWGEEPCP